MTRVKDRGDTICTSAFTLSELLAAPYSHGSTAVAALIEETFSGSFGELIAFDANIARVFAQIRATHAVSIIDAIHLASASGTNVNMFLTTDANLRQIARMTPGIDFVAGLESEMF